MRKLSRKIAHRNSLIRNLATSLVLYESVETTVSKAKEVRGFIDKVLYRSQKIDLNSIKYLNSIFYDKNAVKKIVNELSARYASRNSGYTRIIKSGFRIGDGASTAIIELIDKKTFEDIKDVNTKPNNKKTKNKEAGITKKDN